MDKKKVSSALEAGGNGLALIDPATGAIMSAVGAVLGLAVEAAKHRQRTWWAHVVGNKTDEEFERTLEYELTEEHGAVILEGLRAALQTVDDAALVPLARLTRMYLRTKTGSRDRFFRGCTRLLCDADAEDLQLLRRLIVWSLTVVQRDEFLLTQRGAQLYVARDEYVDHSDGTAGKYAIQEFDASRALELLADYNLLRPTIFNFSGGNVPNILAKRPVFLHLHRVLTGHDEDDN